MLLGLQTHLRPLCVVLCRKQQQALVMWLMACVCGRCPNHCYLLSPACTYLAPSDKLNLFSTVNQKLLPLCRIGTSFDWSVAVHAYGIPLSSDWGLTVPYGAYTFLDLPKVVAFQQSMLIANGSTNPATAPQAMLAATEQNWASNPPNNGVSWPYADVKMDCISQHIQMQAPLLIFSQSSWGHAHGFLRFGSFSSQMDSEMQGLLS